MNIFLICCFIPALFSCSDTQENIVVKKPDLLENAVVSTQPDDTNHAHVDTLNYTDAAGLKQGTWKTYKGNFLKKVEIYKDNLLHGRQYEFWKNGEICYRDCVNGKLHGYNAQYHSDSTFAMSYGYFENNENIWYAFPWELSLFIVPVKGWGTKDTVDISVPYNSGKVMYLGTITPRGSERFNAIGMHYAYYETGQLKARIDYDRDSIWIYSLHGKLLKAESVYKWCGHMLKELDINS